MIIINFLITMLVTALSFYGFITLFSLCKKLVFYKRLDELQKNIIFETFTVSFIIILLLHLSQFLMSLLGKDISFIVSPGLYQGALIGANPFHMDSFMFDLIIISVVDVIKKVKYEVISKRDFLLKFVLPIGVLFVATVVVGILLYLEI